jgi:GGDEF domain-containing protein
MSASPLAAAPQIAHHSDLLPHPTPGDDPLSDTSTADLDIVNLILDPSGRVMASNAAGGRLRDWHGDPLGLLADLPHPADRLSVHCLVESAFRRGRSAGMVQIRASVSAPARCLQLLLSRNDCHPSSLAQDAGAGMVNVQGWDITSGFFQQARRGSGRVSVPPTDAERRSAFAIRLEDDLARWRGTGQRTALLLTKVTAFAGQNEDVSRDSGHRTRATVAERLRASLRPGDDLVLIGTDVIAVICHCVSGWPTLGVVLDRLRGVALESVHVAGGDFRSAVSINAMFADELAHGGDTAGALLIQADQLSTAGRIH